MSLIGYFGDDDSIAFTATTLRASHILDADEQNLCCRFFFLYCRSFFFLGHTTLPYLTLLARPHTCTLFFFGFHDIPLGGDGGGINRFVGWETRRKKKQNLNANSWKEKPRSILGHTMTR